MKDTLTWIETGIVRLNGSASFREVNAELEQYCLPVEPLSEKKTISQFIREGGIGYNSLLEGTIGSKIFQLSGTFSGKSFTYGSEYMTLYNAGYPLHRIVEGSLFSQNLAKRFGQVEEVIFPVRIKKKIKASFQNIKIDQFHIPDFASNVFFINNFGAGLMGLEGEGIVTTYQDRTEANSKLEKEVWEKRFFEDQIPADHDTMKFLTMRSRLAEIYKVFNENSQGLFFALCVHNGILLLMSGKRRQLDRVGENIRQIPPSFEVRV